MKLAFILLGLFGSVQAEAATRYQITLTNAGALHFSPPVVYVPSVMNAGYQSGNSCPRATSAVDCLRQLSQPIMPASTIRFFAPYLPSVLTQIETRFGSAATERLNLSPAGDLRIKAVMIH